MKYLAILAALAAFVAATPSESDAGAVHLRRNNPDDLLIFTCDQMPEVCHNMCYGAYCVGIGTRLKYDKPDSTTKRNRRKAAGCIESGGNRCSVKKNYDKGYQCDEYPFASTAVIGGGDDQTRINRCVPAGENRKQGGIINSFYRKTYCGGGPCEFTAKFSNAGNIDMCDSMNGNKDVCNDKDNEVEGPGFGEPAKDGDEADDGTDDDGGNPEPEADAPSKKVKRTNTVHPRYLTSSGLEIEIPGGARIGQRAVTVLPRNATLWDEQANDYEWDGDEEDDDDFDYMIDNLDVRDDTIVAEIS
ncbi:hypothetical protein DBV05_g9315 [Lasiodiplodia theobromae]|uniref:Deoxyribonuclease NucA/NucB domain-containing protein n=1 Tax=Lasiodiplodia theobromae TaxID=45133 RepID=A0A5N5D2U9_9PEZI|nr:hypothetical protein DBV05_g9315 [Lasiodiplodia theobromae]